MTDTQAASRRAATAKRASNFTESVIREMTAVFIGTAVTLSGGSVPANI